MERSEKHELYKKALLVYKNQVINKNQFGLCNALYIASDGVINVNNLQDLCPEIYKHKPKKKSNNIFWWIRENTAKRIQIFEQAIEETKEV